MLGTGVALLALGVAGCGSTGAPSGTVTNAAGPGPSGPSPALEVSKCMRAHGVLNFPDPDRNGGINIGGTGLNPRAPAFQAAQRDCQKYFANRGHPQAMTAAEREKAVAFAECMRTHGQPDFPDPLTGTPSGSTLMLSLNGLLFEAGPSLNPQSPAFQQAAADCGVQLQRVAGKAAAP
jgi:hypothetical protein